MQRSTHRLKLNEIGPHVKCVLCLGYLIDATTIVECLHSFCRSCLLNYLSNNHIFCPICEVQIHKTNPLLSIKPDKTLQDIVYKLVPGLFRSEMRRRREFYLKHPQKSRLASPEERGVGADRVIYSPDDSFHLSLEYYDVDREREERESSSSQSSESGATDSGSSTEQPPSPLRRYLQCPALVTIAILKKFIRMKFDLTPSHRVEVFHRRVSLANEYTLLDVAYIYTWKGSGPMRFFYRITEVPPEPHSIPLPIEMASTTVDVNRTIKKTENKAATSATSTTTSNTREEDQYSKASTSKTQPLVVQTSKTLPTPKVQQKLPGQALSRAAQQELITQPSTERTSRATALQVDHTLKTNTKTDQPSKVLPREQDQFKTTLRSQSESTSKVISKQMPKPAVKTQRPSKAAVSAKRNAEAKTKIQAESPKSSAPLIKNQQDQPTKPMTVKMKLEQLKSAKSKIQPEQVSKNMLHDGKQEQSAIPATSKDHAMLLVKSEKQDGGDNKPTAVANDGKLTKTEPDVKEGNSNNITTSSSTVKNLPTSEPSTSSRAVSSEERRQEQGKNIPVNPSSKVKTTSVKISTNVVSKSPKESSPLKTFDKQLKNVTRIVSSLMTPTSDTSVPPSQPSVATVTKQTSCTETSSKTDGNKTLKDKSASDICPTNISDSKSAQFASVDCSVTKDDCSKPVVNTRTDEDGRDSKSAQEIRSLVGNTGTGATIQTSPNKAVTLVQNSKKNPNQQILTKNEEIIKPHAPQKRPQFSNESMKRKFQMSSDSMNKNKPVTSTKKSRLTSKPGIISAVKRLQDAKAKIESEIPLKKSRPNEVGGNQPSGSGASQVAVVSVSSASTNKEPGNSEEKLVPNQIFNKPAKETIKLEPQTKLSISKTELTIPVPKPVHVNLKSVNKQTSVIETRTKEQHLVDSKTVNHVGTSDKKTSNHSPSYSYLKSTQSSARDNFTINNEVPVMNNPQHPQVSHVKKETENKVMTPLPKLIEIPKSGVKKVDGNSAKVNVQKGKPQTSKDVRLDPKQDGIGAWDLTARSQTKPHYMSYPPQTSKLPHTFTSPPQLSPSSHPLFPAPSHSISPMATQLKIPNLSRLPQQRPTLPSPTHHRVSPQLDGGSPAKLRRPDFQNRLGNLPQTDSKRVDPTPPVERHSEEDVKLDNPTTSRTHDSKRIGPPLPGDFRNRMISSPLRDHRRVQSSASPKSSSDDQKNIQDVPSTSRVGTAQEMSESAALRQQLEMQARLWGAGASMQPEWFQDPSYVKRLDTFMKSLGRRPVPQTAIFPSNNKSNNNR